TLEQILDNYILNLPESKRKKALINHELLSKIKNLLLNPKDHTLYNKNTRSWAKNKFQLEEITPGDHRVVVKATGNPVLIRERFYDVFCHIHSVVTEHGGQKQTWISVSEKWGWVKQSLVEKFVNNCTVYAIRKPAFHPLAAKPIIAKNFLSRIQALTSKRAIKVAAYLFELFHSLGSPLMILQSDNGKEFVAQQKLGKWQENTGRKDWSFGLRFVVVEMNNSWCRSHKKIPYELVYGYKPRGNSTLVNELYDKQIYNKEDIPDTVQIEIDDTLNLDDDMEVLVDDMNQNSNLALIPMDQNSNFSDKLLNSVLADITKQNSNVTGHEILRNTAQKDLELYTKKMTKQMMKK
ncbi:26165_t:CDS:2, partial [Gigaspora rosea]